MTHRIVISSDIKRQLQTLPGHIKPIARQRIAGLSVDPRPPRSKELVGHAGYYRLHIATSYRLVWLVDDDDRYVEIAYVGPKPPDLNDTLGLARPDSNAPDA
jgi:mRNA-degrading endonuclease RelE of RelBE toxin-antitoxin system